MFASSQKIKSISLITLSFLLFVASFVLFTPVRAHAAPPGCYANSQGQYVEANCATEGQARAIEAPQNKCFVAPASNSGIGDFVETDCSTFEVGSSNSGGNKYDGKTLAELNDCNESGGNIDQSNCGIIKYLVMFINILSALVGVVVIGSIIYGGIQYSMAGSDPQKVSAAKNHIRNAIIALLFFIFAYSFLNYLVPGGVL